MMTQGDSIVSLAPGANNPADFDLLNQPQLVMNYGICANQNMNFTSDTIVDWDWIKCNNPNQQDKM